MQVKDILKNAVYGILRSYEGKRFWPSLISKLLMALLSALITAFFADTLFSRHSTANQIFSALFFYFLLLSVSKIIAECKRGGFGGRLKKVLGNMFRLKPPALWFFLVAVVLGLLLPYAFVLSLALLLLCSAASGERSMLLSIKTAVTKKNDPAKTGRGLAAFAGGLLACGLVVGILSGVGLPTLYGAIDGSNPKSDIAQVDKDKDQTNTDPQPDNQGGTDVKPGNNETVVPYDTDLKEAAQTLTDLLIKYAGTDRDSFETLFRNTESSVIDQYYNTSYDTFREYGKSLIIPAAQDQYGDTVWFTALYYRLPADYPAQREQSVYLSTIMTRSSADGWKIEWNGDTRAKLQADYDDAGFTHPGRDARDAGRPWAKFFVPFDLYYEFLYYDNAVLCKLTEMYIDEEGNVNLTFYASNSTDKDVALTGIDLTITDGGADLFTEHLEVDLLVQQNNATSITIRLPQLPQNITDWGSPSIKNFAFTYDIMDYNY